MTTINRKKTDKSACEAIAPFMGVYSIKRRGLPLRNLKQDNILPHEEKMK